MTITHDELVSLTVDERELLLRELLTLTGPAEAARPRRRSARLLVFLGSAVAGLLAWIVVMGFQLPERATAEAWRGVWIGFDILEALGLLATLSAAWRARQILVPAALITGTLFFADAWFDVTLSWGTDGFWGSVASAVALELPLTAVLWWVARRTVNSSILAVRARVGLTGRAPRLCELPIYEPADALPTRSEMTSARHHHYLGSASNTATAR